MKRQAPPGHFVSDYPFEWLQKVDLKIDKI